MSPVIRDRATWDEWGLDIARAVAGRADCSRRQVGAVVITSEVDGRRIIATGYNGAAAGIPGCLSAGACPRAQSQVAPDSSYDSGPGACHALHAEQNALLRAPWTEMQDAVLYVTDEPCPGCWKMITGTPLARVVWPEGVRVYQPALGTWE